MNKTKHDILDKFLILFAILFNLGVLILSTLWLFTDIFGGSQANLTDTTHLGINEKVSYGLFLSGALGGAFYCLRAIYQRLGEAYTPIDGKEPNPKGSFNIRTWLYWFLYRPIQGGILALVALCLINTNLLSAEELNSSNVKSFYSLIAVGFLAGFGSHELIHKVQEIIQVTFAKAQKTGSSSKQKVKENTGEED